MKIIVILALLALLSCAKEVSKESIQNNNELKGTTYREKTILGGWYNINDNSALEFWSADVMYLFSDTLDRIYHTNILRFNWNIVNRILILQSYDLVPQLTYKFTIGTLTDSTLILLNSRRSVIPDTKIYTYQLRWRF